MMVQGPVIATTPPSLPADPNVLLHGIVPLIGVIAVAVCIGFVVKWVVNSPLGDALAEAIRHASKPRRHFKGARGEWLEVPVEGGADEARVTELEGQVQALQLQVGELAERLDFTERVLAEKRGTPQLGRGQ
jgi:hypothetical protein